MSHTVKIQTKFTQLNPLKKAFEHFGWDLVEKAKARVYPNDPKQNDIYDFVAKNPQTGSSSYDVGIQVGPNGEVEVHCDFYGGSIAQTLGTNLDKLRGEYAYRVIEEKYAYEGASVFRTENQDGSMDVIVESQ